MKNNLPLFFLLLSLTTSAQIGAKIKQQSKTNITGIWQNSQLGFQMTLILNEDKTGEFDGEAIKYSLTETTLSISSNAETTTYKYSLQTNTLTLSGGDLQTALTFTRHGNSLPPPTVSIAEQKQETGIIGIWSGNGESIEFTQEGKCNYLGQTYACELSSGHITLNTSQGNIMMAYTLANNQLSLTVNGKLLVYSKGGTAGKQAAGGRGTVAQELVGKWCYVNIYNTTSNSSSTSNCMTLNADGTYEYFGESSTGGGAGSTASQTADRGTWSVQGNTIFYNSQARGPGSYQFQKQNHPKNGDPMIVIDGQAFVTFYNKAPWQ